MSYSSANFQNHLRPWEDQVRFNAPTWHENPQWILDDQPILQDRSPASMERYFQQPEQPWTAMRLLPLPYVQTDSYVQQAPQPVPIFDQRIHYRFASPSNSGPSSSETSSGWSDRQSTPWSSPCPSHEEFSPHMHCIDAMPPTFGGGLSARDGAIIGSAPCVSMHDVQYAADDPPDKLVFDDEYFTPIAEEGYQPKVEDIEDRSNGDFVDTTVACHSELRPESPNIKRRRNPLTRSNTSPVISARVTKKSTTSRRRSSSGAKTANKQNGIVDTPLSNRAFPCVFAMYGCQSTFGSKNEWKRHVFTQHMRVGFWRCDQCEHRDRKSNDFNRKDLFIQHIRRMHPLNGTKPESPKSTGSRPQKKQQPEEQQLAVIAERCYRKTRELPGKSGCYFCDNKFQGPNSWEERMEHVGGHMEATKKDQKEPMTPAHWANDEALHNYLVREDIVAENKKGCWRLIEGNRA